MKRQTNKEAESQILQGIKKLNQEDSAGGTQQNTCYF